MNTIQVEWESYLRILPKDAPNVQIIETKRAFYAGVVSTIGILGNIASMGDEPCDQPMDNITLELEQFKNDLETGKA